MEFKHVSVLLNETVDSLLVKKDGIYVDPSEYVSYEKSTSSTVVDDSYEG